MGERPDIAWDDTLGAWVVWRHEHVRAVLEDVRCSATASRSPDGAPSPVEVSTADHLDVRQLAWRVLQDRDPWIRARLQGRLAERLDAPLEGPVDLVGQIVAPWCAEVALDLVGAPEGQRPQLRDSIGEAFLIAASAARGDALRARSDAATGRLAAWVHPRVAQRRSQPDVDVLSVLATSARGVPDGQVTAFAVQLLVGLCDSVPFLLGNGLLGLLQGTRPEGVDRQLVEEVLRWGTPSGLLHRQVVAPCTVAGRDLQPGERLVLRVAWANRDPRRYPDPEHLDPTRRARPHLAFGAGRHRCVGAPLVRAACEVGLGGLLAWLPPVTIVEGGVEHGGSDTVGGVARLCVRPTTG